MAHAEHAAPEPGPTEQGDAGAADQQSTPDLVKKVTHEVDTDDMFVQSGE